MGKYILIAALLGMLGLTLWWSVSVWTISGEAEMSGHGYFAMALGIVFSLVVGIGLMALMFYSARHGYDRPPEHDRDK